MFLYVKYCNINYILAEVAQTGRVCRMSLKYIVSSKHILMMEKV